MQVLQALLTHSQGGGCEHKNIQNNVIEVEIITIFM